MAKPPPPPTTTLVWLRQDFRLADNPALTAAVARGGAVLAVYVVDDVTPGAFAMGGASRWWLHHTLAAFAASLAKLGGALILRRGNPCDIIPALAAETGADQVHANALHEPWFRANDRAIASTLQNAGRRLVRHRAATLFDPEAIRTKTGTVYGIYTPFARACLAGPAPRPPLPVPARVPAPAALPPSVALADLALLPKTPDWAGGLRDAWAPGEATAHALLRHFVQTAITGYETQRNLPAQPGTSRLSPHLHWGEISPHSVWHAAASIPGEGARVYRSEILWREFAQYLLWHHPHMPTAPLRAEFENLPWRHDDAGLRAWQRGQTGIPIVDAGMRELWQTGWMHNRVRMIVASFLVKHLLIDWRAGAAWFWDTLVDADLGANSASWQWVAGTGIDAQPFFRVFNPVSQSAKFDPTGEYIETYVPELAALPEKYIHAPWENPPMLQAQTGTAIGMIYPPPMINLADGRTRALDIWRATVKTRAATPP